MRAATSWGLGPPLFLLLFLLLPSSHAARDHRRATARRRNEFQFTAPLYNMSISENARGRPFATADGTTRVGVSLPSPDSQVKFRIVEGDKKEMFKALVKQVGDFAFLRIRHKSDGILNRELKDRYEFVVKATCKRPDEGNLETTSKVELRVTDENDAFPIFNLDTDKYLVDIDDQTPPFTDILRLEASDADEGLNGEVYYSLLNASSDFTIEPLTGWLRTLRTPKAGVYSLTAQVEDRKSRLFYANEEEKQQAWKTEVEVRVKENRKPRPGIVVETRTLDRARMNEPQVAAVVNLNAPDEEKVALDLDDGACSHGFFLKRDSDTAFSIYTVSNQRQEGKGVQMGKTLVPADCSLGLRASVVGRLDLNATASVKLEWTESHDLKMRKEEMSFQVNESVPLHHLVGKIEAIPSNPKDKAHILYSLVRIDNITLPFRIDEKSGKIRVLRELDFERTQLYKFNVSAKLKGQKVEASTMVTVEVRDSNDHSPVWAAKWMRQEPVLVSSSSSPGSLLLKLSASDKDSGDNGRVGFKLASSSRVPFHIDFDSGELRVTEELPKNENLWRLDVFAVDFGWPQSRYSRLSLVLYKNGTKAPPKIARPVAKEPDNLHSPEFQLLPDNIEVAEDASLGQFVARLHAADGDPGYAGLVRYSTDDAFFSVDVYSGNLTVDEDLTTLLRKGEQFAERSISVFAFDSAQPAKSTQTKLKIRIRDVNNHRPVFEQAAYRVSVPEDAELGRELLTVKADDEDGGDGGQVRYRLAGRHQLATIDEKSGKIQLNEELDRETRDRIELTLVAEDRGSPPFVSFANLTILVEDVNDNAPFCIQQVTKVEIPEDWPSGALVTCVTARDVDAGQNGRLRFSLDSPANAPFRVDDETGCVFVNTESALDFELVSSFNLTIDVADNGESMLSTLCQVIVELQDVNENLHPPEFDDVAHEASVYENMPRGTEVTTVLARDPEKKDAAIRYSIVGGEGMGHFTIDPSGIVRTAVVLDRETRSSYWLAVAAEDDSPVPLEAVVHVFVRVLDRNDHRPRTIQPIYFAPLPENSPENTVVVKVDALDEDDVDSADTGSTKSRLTYSIESGDPQSFFSIDPHTGYMMTRGSRKVDREAQKEHEVVVKVCDDGEPQLCSTVVVVINVEDRNDNAPEFKQAIHNFNVPAGVTGTLCRVFAVDADSGINAQLFYNITDGAANFAVDEHGHISTSSPLEHDIVYPLTVQATDMGNPPQSASTRVIVTAVARSTPVSSNRAPKIKKGELTFHVSDNDQVGVAIGMLEAVDADGDFLTWRITEGNINETFILGADAGQLVLARPLEFLPAGVNSMNLKVEVTDGLAKDATTVLIQMSRSLASRPQFSALHYKTQVSEAVPIGKHVYILKATNTVEGGASKPIVYGIHMVEDTAAEDKLRIEPSTGAVVVMESLDFEAFSEIRLVVSARQGNLANYATLSLTVVDENDNSPRFLESDWEAKISMRAGTGSSVLSVAAYDPDAGDNGVIRYSIASGNEAGYFSIHQSTGEIRVARPLPLDAFEAMLTVKAVDGGRTPLSDTATVRILVDTGDHSTTFFTKPLYQAVVKENAAPGTLLALVETEGAKARLSFDGTCPLLSLHPLTGAVSLANWIGSDSPRLVNCSIRADSRKTPAGDTKKVPTTRVTVKFLDVNGHPPVFVDTVYHGFIRENSPAGSAVLLEDNQPLTVLAVDKDSGANALVAYRTVAADEPFFSVDLVSGAVRSRRPLDFERTKEWRFHVEASDMAAQPRTSPVPALVIVTIRDANDETPVFSDLKYEAELRLPTVDGVLITRIRASDADTVGKLRFSIPDKKMVELFRVDTSTGELYTKSNDSSKYKETKYLVPISVSDGVHSTSCEVEITVAASSRDLVFSRSEYRTKLKEEESSPVSRPLIAVSATPKTEATVSYSLLTSHDSFVLNPGTGLLSHTGISVDREKTPVIKLIVQARTEQARAQTVVVVEVDDINDHAPSFISLPLHSVIPLDAKKGDKVLVVKATDADLGLNGQVKYLLRDAPSELLINSNDGKISLKSPFESPGVYEFYVDAQDQGSPSLKSSETVRVEVVDKVLPLFTSTFYRTSVPEIAHKGTVVMKVKAVSNAGGHIGYLLQHEIFKVNFQSGSVSLRKELSDEETKEFNLTVYAIDVTRPGVNSTAIVNVKVLGANDNAPVFSLSSYSVRVRESTPAGTEILQVTASDPDNPKATISYALHDGNSSMFTVDMYSGSITLASALDFETSSSLFFSVTASDEAQLTSTARVTVEVEDVNDESPVFVNPFTRVTMEDSAGEGQFVALLDVLDRDSVSSLSGGHRLLFSVIDGDDSLFSVHFHSGLVLLARNIDDSDLEEPNKILNVSVSDGVHTAYGELVAELKKTGRRMAPPRFEQSTYSVSLRENNALSNKSAVLVVAAREGASPLTFSLGGGDSKAWPLRIDPHSGRLHARTVLDYHERKLYRIPLQVEDAVGRRAFSTLTLNVIDENDNAPVFVARKYETTVSSLAKTGDALFMVSAVDEDEEDAVEYALVGESNDFRVHPRQGVVSAARALSHAAGNTYSLTIRATDQANPPQHATVDVKVTVAAPDVAVPRFSSHHYLFTTPENVPTGSVIGKLQQVDSGVGEVRFSVWAQGAPEELPISVDKSSGRLVVSRPLDRERTELWRFLVRVESANAFSVATVSVRVADVNDNAPVFQGNYDRLAVSEDAPVGTSIAVFSATDKDAAPHSRITFSIDESEDASWFSMDAESGWLLVAKELDRESKDKHQLKVRAMDEGGLSSALDVSVQVKDVNDEPPIFDQREYNVQADPSTLSVGKVITRVTVTDKDLPPFNSSQLFLSAGNEEGLFEVDKKGRVLVRKSPATGRSDTATLTILAFDGRHSTTAPLTVEFKPKTMSRTCEDTVVKAHVVENAKKGNVVVEGDKGEEQRKWQLLSTQDLPFVIDEDGTIRVNAAIDRETKATYSFVREWRRDWMVCGQKIRVEVLDENDNAPRFEKAEQTLTVKENLKASADEAIFLAHLEAIDEDEGENGTVAYELDGGEDAFILHPRIGSLTLVKALDREAVAEYTLVVTARDRGVLPKTAKTVVKVLVADQNDNAPVFKKSEYALQVMEAEAVGYTLATLRADGGDGGETVTYSILPGGEGVDRVSLDPKTGDLKLAKPLDYETLKRLEFEVEAVDSGSPPLKSSTVVRVEVLDENDNAPKFSSKHYKASIAENEPKGTKVVKVFANDSDSGHFGAVVYKLSGPDSEFFTVDDDGWIASKISFDRELKHSYRLSIDAVDGGSPPLSDSSTVAIAVTDVNDNAPEFADCNMTAVVQVSIALSIEGRLQESVEAGHPLLSLSVRDADGEGHAGPFKVQIEGEGAAAFVVDPQLNIVTATKLSHEKRNKYLLTVVASDIGGLSSDCPLTVHVKEESRHRPRLHPLNIQLNALMGEFKGGLIGRLHAEDEDEGDMLRFQLVENSVIPAETDLSLPSSHMALPHVFRVDARSGDIVAEHGIEAGVHKFNASVTDGKFTDENMVRVEVVWIEADVIDHAVALRVKDTTAEEFLAKHVDAFKEVFARHLNVRPEDVQIISLQESRSARLRHSSSQHRHRREKKVEEIDVEMLFVVSRGKNRGLLKPDHVYKSLMADYQQIAEESDNLVRLEEEKRCRLQRYELQTEVCNAGACERGECRERVWLSDQETFTVISPSVDFVAPKHERKAVCVCPDGFDGPRCESEVSKCARNPCHEYQMCVPKDKDAGFECVCPPGTTGDRCDKKDCPDPGPKCKADASVSMAGRGFFELSIPNSVEQRFDVSVRFRTISTDAVLMYAAGIVDFHSLEIVQGHLEYRWDCGVGEGIVKTTQDVSDGEWHTVAVYRKGRKASVKVDGEETDEGWSPEGAHVVNLHHYSQRLVFGAKVFKEDGYSSTVDISRGLVGCVSEVKVDGKALPKTRQGLRLHETKVGCQPLALLGACATSPCKNGAVCRPQLDSFVCVCGSSRYSGKYCEVDTSPCDSRPCPPSVQCIPLSNDYLCKCPSGFTGKHCEMRGIGDSGSSACARNPCGPGGVCIPIQQNLSTASYICNCSTGLQHGSCKLERGFLSFHWPLTWEEVAVLVSLVFVLALLLILIVCLCRSSKTKYQKTSSGVAVYEAGSHVRNPQVGRQFEVPVAPAAPPPLPPRGLRIANNKYSNYEAAQMTGLPTVQVRPLPLNERLSNRDSRSPSLADSNGVPPKRGRGLEAAREYGSAADELERCGRGFGAGREVGRTDPDTLAALRRFGRRKDDGDAIGDSIQCLPTHEEDETRFGWRNSHDAIGAAVRAERLRLEGLTSRVVVGSTELSPLVNDDDYMTMRPSRTTRDASSSESQRRPLLQKDDDDEGMEGPLDSKSSRLFMEVSRVYDDPPVESSTQDKTKFEDIDASDAEEEIPKDESVAVL